MIEQNIKRKRNSTVDLLKGLAVILMIQVHIMELFSIQDIFNSIIGKISLFLGGPPAAPIFMAVMGYFIAKSSKKMTYHIIRGIKLIGLGILLNVGLNFNLLYKVYNDELEVNILNFIFGVDILFLAGLSIIIMALLKNLLNKSFIIPLIFAFIAVSTSSLFINYKPDDNTTVRYLMAYIGSAEEWSYFPLFPWLAYPLLGYSYYLFENKYNLSFKNSHKIKILIIWLLFIVFTFNYALEGAHNLNFYYHHDIMYFFWIIFFLVGYVLLVSIIATYDNFISRFIQYFGINVTAAYVIQWLIIGNLATEVYKSLSLLAVSVWFIVITSAVYLLLLAWNKIQEQKV